MLGVALLAGCATWQRGDGERTAGRIVDDRRITSNIRDRLGNEPVYKFTDVDVRTFQGVVQLSGFVASEDQKQRAGQVAEQTPGVARVVNSIVLKPEGGEMLTPTGRQDTGVPATTQSPQDMEYQQQQRLQQQQQRQLDQPAGTTIRTNGNQNLNPQY
jgi:hyperosmotically inducible periplasmic protein